MTASILILLLAALPVPFEKDGNWGYRDHAGKVVIEARYSIANAFSRNGIAAVANRDGWAYIDRTGRVLVHPFVFDNGPDDFREGLARFTDGGKFGFFNRRGRIAIPARYDFVEPFVKGRAAFCEGCRRVNHGEHWSMEGGKWGQINRAGRVVTSAR